MAYSYLNFGTMKLELAERLGDPNEIFWTDAELGLWIQEALSYWNAATMFYKNRYTFNTTTNQLWYDLTQTTGTLLPMTFTDTTLLSELLYNLIEPQKTGGVYPISDMWALDEFTQAMQRRQDQFLLETGMLTNQAIISLPPAPQNRVPLADTTVDVKRAAFIDSNGKYTTLWRTDEWGAQSFNPTWSVSPQAPPSSYSVAVVPPLTLTMIPPPQGTGTLELIRVLSGPTLNPTSVSGVALGVPADFVWVIRMGALADLLGKDGQGRDAQRAQYAQARWDEGIALAKMFTSVINAYLDGVQVFPQPIRSFSTYRPGWQNEAAGTPNALGVMSWNLLAVAPQPDTGPHSIMLDMVQNAVVPVLNGDFIQIGREDLDAIFDYAQHLASFKSGGNEFADTIDLYKNCVNRAKARNAKIRTEVPFYEPLSNVATKQAAEAEGAEAQAATS
jgi:hypothetical protein